MAVSIPGFQWRFWSGGRKENQPVKKGSSLYSLNSSDFGTDTKKSPAKAIDKEFDIVVVSSDDVHLSGYDSDGPEWSIGWEEPHGVCFHGDEDDDGFAVLVPSYKPGCKELVNGPNNQFLNAVKNLSSEFLYEGSNSLQH